MQIPHSIALLAYDGFQLLDAAGPASVFAGANDALEREGYRVTVLSPEGGPITSNSGVSLMTNILADQPPETIDTLLVAGSLDAALRAITDNRNVRDWVQRCAAHASRFGSVCTGAVVLAAFGLLDGKRATTHWKASSELTRLFPKVAVEPDALFVNDGKLWTSAGVTTGIDMALAMVERDHGADIANRVAQHLVLYQRRPGYQSQFSWLLLAQTTADNRFAGLIEWMQGNLDLPLHVAILAERAGLAERSFHRKFVKATGQTPAHFVEALRLDAARDLLSKGGSLKMLANKVGFRSNTQLAAAFQRRFGVTPKLFRELHGAASIDAAVAVPSPS